MERILNAFVAWISTPLGFGLVNAPWVIGTPLCRLGWIDLNTLTYWLSVEAIVLGGAVLVAGRADMIAMHAKLDKLVLMSPGDNREVGLEREPSATIEQVRDEIERRR